MIYPYSLDEQYRRVTDHFPNSQLRPVIGITGNFGEKGCELAEAYYRSIEAAGGIPVVLPPTESKTLICSLLCRLDGLLFSGGGDIDPQLQGEEPIEELGSINPKRDLCELLYARLAYDRHIPMMGICRGMQVVALALGGKLSQDIAATMADGRPLKHSQQAPRYMATHSVFAEEGSLVAGLMDSTEFRVNSFHHQAVSDPGALLRVTARASDGVVEALESTDMRSLLCVQWHPECQWEEGDKHMLQLFRYLVGEAESFRQARRLHSLMLTLDSHCDTPICLERGSKPDRREEGVCVDLHRMTEGGLDAAVMAVYLPQGPRTAEAHEEATRRCDLAISSLKQLAADNYNIMHCMMPRQIFQAKTVNKKGLIIGIENGYAMGRDLSCLERWRREGVVYMTLCHNGDNDLCDSAMKSQKEHGGLSELGRSAVAEMNRVGLMIDLSHAAESTFYQVLDLSAQPVLCSHSSSRQLCDHPRNLSDDQLEALARRGGVAQATFYNDFLVEQGEATISDAVRHIMHMIDVAGIDSVGIGSDFDGDGGVLGLRDASYMMDLTRRLMAEGLTLKHLRKIWGGNFVRVMGQVQREARIEFPSRDFARAAAE